MKTIGTFILLAVLSGIGIGRAAESPDEELAPVAPPAVIDTNAPELDPGTNDPVVLAPGVATNAPAEPVLPAPATAGDTNLAAFALAGADSADGLRLNFRNAPLELVLNYLSEAAGFVIVLETEVKGRVDVWSNQPLTREEAVNLLNSVLNRNGYAAIRNGRTLTIVSRDEAKKRDIPVKTGNKPEEIPKNEEMVTQIIPVRYANATQMVKDLQPLLPTFANLTANESGNALVLTDVQSDVRRMVEIVKALDTSISGISAIKVFPLQYADAKELAAELKELFPAPSTTGGRGNNQGFQLPGRFGGGFGGGPGGAGAAAAAGAGQSEARQAAARVTAVADERTNSLVVSAPDEIMPTIELLVKEIDTNAENITELRVFPLRFADPQEMADILSNLFPDDSKTTDNRSQLQLGRGGFGGAFANRANSQTTTSDRTNQKGRVLAVPDLRTSSVIVSAAKDLMPQIGEMIAQLDSNPAKKQKVFVYSLENADAQQVQQVLQDMFQRNSTSSRNSRSSANQNSVLNNRSQQNQSGTSGSSFGSSGAGGSRNNQGTGGTGGF